LHQLKNSDYLTRRYWGFTRGLAGAADHGMAEIRSATANRSILLSGLEVPI